MKNPTIYDVASAAGVSITTVSDVLNERSRVADETAAAVHAVIAEMGYRPRANSRRRCNLTQQHRSNQNAVRHGQVLLLIPDPDPAAAHTVQMERIAKGAAEFLSEFECDLISAGMSVDSHLPHCLADKQVKGVMLRTGKLSQEQHNALSNVPCVTFFSVDMDVPGDQVVVDNEAIGRMSVDYLLKHGCRRMAVLNPDRAHPSFCLRAQAFSFGARMVGVEPLSCWTDRGQLLKHVLPSPPDVGEHLGIFVAGYDQFNNEIQVQEQLKTAGLTEENGVIVIGAALDAAHARIGVVPERIGRHCAEQLVWRMAHPLADRRRIMIEPRLTLPVNAVD